jgi:hypothetical protein
MNRACDSLTTARAQVDLGVGIGMPWVHRLVSGVVTDSVHQLVLTKEGMVTRSVVRLLTSCGGTRVQNWSSMSATMTSERVCGLRSPL